MWNSDKFSLPSVLIVENKKGDIFIVENQENSNQIDKILGKEEKHAKSKIKHERASSSRESSPAVTE